MVIVSWYLFCLYVAVDICARFAVFYWAYCSFLLASEWQVSSQEAFLFWRAVRAYSLFQERANLFFDFQKMWNRRHLAVFIGTQMVSMLVNDVRLSLVTCFFTLTLWVNRRRSSRMMIFVGTDTKRFRSLPWWMLQALFSRRYCNYWDSVALQRSVLSGSVVVPFYVCMFIAQNRILESLANENKKCCLCLSQKKLPVASIRFFAVSMILAFIYMSFIMWVHILSTQVKH